VLDAICTDTGWRVQPDPEDAVIKVIPISFLNHFPNFNQVNDGGTVRMKKGET
jgi:hypothetical protein